jgi:hypothetical protein
MNNNHPDPLVPRRPLAATAQAGGASPCVGVCRMDAASGWCEGCLRTLDEIAAWGTLPAVGRRAVLARLAQRRVVWRALRAAGGTGLRPDLPTGTPPDAAGAA